MESITIDETMLALRTNPQRHVVVDSIVDAITHHATSCTRVQVLRKHVYATGIIMTNRVRLEAMHGHADAIRTRRTKQVRRNRPLNMMYVSVETIV